MWLLVNQEPSCFCRQGPGACTLFKGTEAPDRVCSAMTESERDNVTLPAGS
jgi:hypothetical protein